MRFALLAALLCASGLSASAREGATPAETVRFVLHHDLSPDGKTLAIAWRGDLFLVPAEGGTATRLTFHPADDSRPRFSHDGSQIAFTSERTGVEQAFVMPAAGGRPEQLSFHGEGTRTLDWHPDGSRLLVRAARDRGPFHPERFYDLPLPSAGREQAAPTLSFTAGGWAAAVSPDGRHIAWSRGGSAWWKKGHAGSSASRIWVFDRETRTHRPVTQHDRGDREPRFQRSPHAVFVAGEDGPAADLVRIDLATGARRRLTAFSDDGVLTLSVARDAPRAVVRVGMDLHLVEWQEHDGAPTPDAPTVRPLAIVHEGAPLVEPTERLVFEKATALAWTDDAREFALVIDDDLWVMDGELREPIRVTETAAEEAYPVFSADRQSLYFTSAHGGRVDVWRARRKDVDRPWWTQPSFVVDRLTDDDAVESDLRIVPQSNALAYVKGVGDLWLHPLDDRAPRRVLAAWSPPDFDLSPDGRWLAYAVDDDNFNRDVWIASLVDEKFVPFNVSRHPDDDREPRWSPDGKLLAFVGQRWHDEADVVYAWLRADDEEKSARDRKLEKGLEAMKSRKPPRTGPTPPPDSPPATPAEAPPVAAAPWPLQWSGLWLGEPPLPTAGLRFDFVLAQTEDGAWHATIDVAGRLHAERVQLLQGPNGDLLEFEVPTEAGPLRASGRRTGDRIEGTWRWGTVLEGRFSLAAVAPAAGAKATPPPPPNVEIHFEGLEDRVQRLPLPNAEEDRLVWSADGKRLAFRARAGKDESLFAVTFPDELEPKRVAGAPGLPLVWLDEPSRWLWLADGVPTIVPEKGDVQRLPFRIHGERSRGPFHAGLFETCWRIMRDRWYDPHRGEAWWSAMREKYLPSARAALHPQELEQVVQLLLGELRGSHCGFRLAAPVPAPGAWRPTTLHLGLLFTPTGDGLVVSRVVRRGPCAQREAAVVPGERLLSIDGVAVPSLERLEAALTGPPGRAVRLVVRGLDGKEREFTVEPISYEVLRGLMYDEWVRETREAVLAGSAGRCGYLHVPDMDWPSFERFEQEIYKVGHGKDGLIIDVRNNGGGFTADHLLTCLLQPHHATTVARGGGMGYPQDRLVYARWTKPIVVLCNERSFSNAEIFSHAIKSLGRGKVVGMPTAGGVISTGRATIRDVGTLRLPFRGWFVAATGEDMESNGCVPDHIVPLDPNHEEQGVDPQLERAVEVLLGSIAEERARPSPVPRYASERK